MKEGKKTLKDSLSMLLQAIQKAEKEKLKEKKPPVLTDGEEASVIMKEISQLNETIRSCPAERTDILDACRERIAVYEKYAPYYRGASLADFVWTDTIAKFCIPPTPTPTR